MCYTRNIALLRKEHCATYSISDSFISNFDGTKLCFENERKRVNGSCRHQLIEKATVSISVKPIPILDTCRTSLSDTTRLANRLCHEHGIKSLVSEATANEYSGPKDCDEGPDWFVLRMANLPPLRK
jgi:hypothetical protein